MSSPIGFMKDRPTLAEVTAWPRSFRKDAIVPVKKAKRLRDSRGKAAEKKWRDAVWARDLKQCQHCHITVFRIEDLVPWRGECHHLKSRRVQVVRNDVRNGLLLCRTCHCDVTEKRLTIGQSPKLMFEVEGERYIHGGKELQFTRRDGPVVKETRG